MKKSYICPDCRGHLNVGEEILFVAKTNEGVKGIVVLSTKLGDYKRFKHPEFKYEKGDSLEFYCPLCHGSLVATDLNDNLAKVLLVDEKGEEYEVLFSGIAGENCTYKIKEDDMEVFGESSAVYMNYFGEGPRY